MDITGISIEIRHSVVNGTPSITKTWRRAKGFAVGNLIAACVLVGCGGASEAPSHQPETAVLASPKAPNTQQLAPALAGDGSATRDPLWGTPFILGDTVPTSPPGFGEMQFVQRPAGNGRIIEGWTDQALFPKFISTNAWITGDGSGYLMIEGGYKHDPLESKPGVSTIVLAHLDEGKLYRVREAQRIVLPEGFGPTFIVDAKDDRVLIRTLEGRFYWFAYKEREFEEADSLSVIARQTHHGQLIESNTRLSASTNAYGWNEWIPTGQSSIHVVAGAKDVSSNSNGWDASAFGESKKGIAIFDDQSTEPAVPTWYFPAGNYGLLRIVDATSIGQLILVDTTGSVLVFDVTMRAFVDQVELQSWPWYEGPHDQLP